MPTPYDEERSLRLKEAAAFLGMSERSLQRKVQRGEIASIQCNRSRWFRLADLIEWQERHRIPGGRHNG